MTGSMEALWAATILFVGGHLLISGTPVRDALVAKWGANRYRGVYSLLTIVLLIWMILAFRDAPFVDLWTAGTAIKHIPLTLMVFVLIMLAASETKPNPTRLGSRNEGLPAGPTGIFTISRHPTMWAIGIWAVMHAGASGHLAGVILFGGFAVLAFLGTLSIDKKKKALSGEAWNTYMARTSNIPFAAALSGKTRIDWRGIGIKPVIFGIIAYGVILVFHEWLFGKAPAGFVSGLI